MKTAKRIANLLVHLGTWLPVLLLIIFWKQIPAQIPVHYNAAGEITKWGGKSMLIMLVMFLFLVYITHLICMRVIRPLTPPEKMYSRKLASYVTESDREYGFMVTETYLAWTDALVVLLFDEIIWSSAAVQTATGFGDILLYGDLVLLAALLVWYMVLLARRKKQIRLRAAEEAERKTDGYDDREERTIGDVDDCLGGLSDGDYGDQEERTVGDVDDRLGGLSDGDYDDREERTVGDIGRVSSEKEDDM